MGKTKFKSNPCVITLETLPHPKPNLKCHYLTLPFVFSQSVESFLLCSWQKKCSPVLGVEFDESLIFCHCYFFFFYELVLTASKELNEIHLAWFIRWLFFILCWKRDVLWFVMLSMSRKQQLGKDTEKGWSALRRGCPPLQQIGGGNSVFRPYRCSSLNQTACRKGKWIITYGHSFNNWIPTLDLGVAMMNKTDTFVPLQACYTGVSWQVERPFQYRIISSLTQEVQIAVGAHWQSNHPV